MSNFIKILEQLSSTKTRRKKLREGVDIDAISELSVSNAKDAEKQIAKLAGSLMVYNGKTIMAAIPENSNDYLFVYDSDVEAIECYKLNPIDASDAGVSDDGVDDESSALKAIKAKVKGTVLKSKEFGVAVLPDGSPKFFFTYSDDVGTIEAYRIQPV